MGTRGSWLSRTWAALVSAAEPPQAARVKSRAVMSSIEMIRFKRVPPSIQFLSILAQMAEICKDFLAGAFPGRE